VRLTAGSGLQLAVRINLSARERSMDRPDPARLKSCVAPDYYILAPAGEDASMAAHAAQDILLLFLPVEIFPETGSSDAKCPLAPLRGRVLVDPVVTGLVELLAQGSTGGDTGLNASVLQTLVLTLMRIAGTRAGRADRGGGLTSRQLKLLRSHVETRLDRPIRNADLASLAGLSPYHFARSFKESMGAAPASWIRMRRVTVAQNLLADRSRSITDVAAAVGYESPSRFARAFREATGVSPSAFRRSRV